MMIEKEIYTTFKTGSRTYFYSSLFFPEPLKSDVFILYSFVRKADDFVDAIPQQVDAFYSFCADYRACLRGKKSNDNIINAFVDLLKRKNIPQEWIDSFLAAMEMDIRKDCYNTLDETKEYMYGSAEVIGLCMARIFNLPEESYSYAQMLGRAMQYINFIRDIDEDNGFGRCYLPIKNEEGLSSLIEGDSLHNRDAFISFIRKQIDLYKEWQVEAEKGYSYIPKRYLIPIKTAADMYKWTADKIYKDPAIVYSKKVKPGKAKIIGTIIKNSIQL